MKIILFIVVFSAACGTDPAPVVPDAPPGTAPTISGVVPDRGFIGRDADVDSLAMALVALYDGLAINRMLGMSEQANKKAWIAAVRAIVTGMS